MSKISLQLKKETINSISKTYTQRNKVNGTIRTMLVQKEMATYSSILAWEIPWSEEPGGLHSAELQKSWT